MTCAHCHQPFEKKPGRGRAPRFCSPRCRFRARDKRAPDRRRPAQRARTAQRIFEDRRIVAIDSETPDDPRGPEFPKRLTLVCASTGEVLEGKNLRSWDVIPWLLRLDGEGWMFVMDYDVSFWLRDLPPTALDKLRRTTRCQWGSYFIKHIPRKSLFIKNKKSGRWIQIWDVWSFVQSSLVKWLEDWKLAPKREIERIARMKQARGRLSEFTDREVREYCMREVKYTEAGVRELKRRTRLAGIVPSFWHSPGSLASRVMLDHRLHEHKPQEEHPKAEEAYYGGRIETSGVGLLERKRGHAYDIKSAYPWAMQTLPCFAHGKWTRRTPKPGDIALVWVRWRRKRKRDRPTWGPLPVRRGSLRFETEGRGWYWMDELRPWLESKRHPFVFEFGRAHVWVQSCDHRPFEWVAPLFEERKRLQKANDPAEYVLKLALNSIYGKLRQHSGVGRLRCTEWAGLITARVRARIAEVLIRHGDAVRIVATDGIYTTRKFPTGQNKLGQWTEERPWKRLFVVQPGFYELDGFKLKTRGFGTGSVDFDKLLDDWRAHVRASNRDAPQTGRAFTEWMRRIEWPTTEASKPGCIGYRLAIFRNKPELTGTWVEQRARVSFDPRPRRTPRAGSRLWTETVAPTPKESRILTGIADDPEDRYWPDGEELGDDKS